MKNKIFVFLFTSFIVFNCSGEQTVREKSQEHLNWIDSLRSEQLHNPQIYMYPSQIMDIERVEKAKQDSIEANRDSSWLYLDSDRVNRWKDSIKNVGEYLYGRYGGEINNYEKEVKKVKEKVEQEVEKIINKQKETTHIYKVSDTTIAIDTFSTDTLKEPPAEDFIGDKNDYDLLPKWLEITFILLGAIVILVGFIKWVIKSLKSK